MKTPRVSFPRAFWQMLGMVFCVGLAVSVVHAQPAKRRNGSPTPSPSPPPSPSPLVANFLSPNEAAFVQAAWAASTAELKRIHLALQNSQSKAVRGFANRQLQEHTRSYNDLKTIAKHYGLRLAPETTDSQEAYQQLGQRHGPEFDQAYLTMAVETYSRELAADKEMQAGVKNAEVKGYVDAEMPRQEGRLQAAKEMLAGLESAKQ